MKKIVFTHSINSIVSKFTSLFLAIYFLKITDGNFISVVLYYTLKYSLNAIFSFLSLKFLNKNNVLKFYRIGLFSNGFCLFVLLLLPYSIVQLVCYIGQHIKWFCIILKMIHNLKRYFHITAWLQALFLLYQQLEWDI